MIERSTPPGTDNMEKLAAGYTVARIRSWTPERIEIRQARRMHQDMSPDQIDAKVIPVSDPEKLHKETTMISSIFIEMVWAKISDWIKNHPPGFSLPGDDNAGEPIPISLEKIKEEVRKQPQDIIDIIKQYTSSTIVKLVGKWHMEQEFKMLKESPTPEEKDQNANYARYKKIIRLGKSNVGDNTTLQPVQQVERHLSGGFSTARDIITSFFEVIPKVYLKKYGHSPNKKDLTKLITGARPIVMAIADSNIPVLAHLPTYLMTDIINFEEVSIFDGFDLNKFSIIEKGERMSLEIRPDILDQFEELINTRKSPHTGCAAFHARGVNSKDVVKEFYDWYAGLYEALYMEPEARQ